MRTTPGHGIAAFKKWSEDEIQLNDSLEECKYKVHSAFCGKDKCLIVVVRFLLDAVS